MSRRALLSMFKIASKIHLLKVWYGCHHKNLLPLFHLYIIQNFSEIFKWYHPLHCLLGGFLCIFLCILVMHKLDLNSKCRPNVYTNHILHVGTHNLKGFKILELLRQKLAKYQKVWWISNTKKQPTAFDNKKLAVKLVL